MWYVKLIILVWGHWGRPDKVFEKALRNSRINYGAWSESTKQLLFFILLTKRFSDLLFRFVLDMRNSLQFFLFSNKSKNSCCFCFSRTPWGFYYCFIVLLFFIIEPYHCCFFIIIDCAFLDTSPWLFRTTRASTSFELYPECFLLISFVRVMSLIFVLLLLYHEWYRFGKTFFTFRHFFPSLHLVHAPSPPASIKVSWELAVLSRLLVFPLWFETQTQPLFVWITHSAKGITRSVLFVC